MDHMAASYCKTVCREIEDRLKETIHASELSTVYFGGGTPGLVDAVLIGEILESLRTHVGIDAQAEISLETTPDTITRAKIEQWNEIGNQPSFNWSGVTTRF